MSDTELVKRDILNHFQTRRGERLHNPEYGSIIWELTFEAMTDDLREAILADAQRIIADEPRVRVTDITIDEFRYGFQIEMNLYFINENIAEPMYVQFNQEAQLMTSI